VKAAGAKVIEAEAAPVAPVAPVAASEASAAPEEKVAVKEK